MERLASFVLIKHMCKADLQKDKFLFVKGFISVHMQTFILKRSPKI